MSKDLGYDINTVEKLIDRFTNIHRIILYNKNNKELLVKNWYKYNWTKSNKLDKPLLKEIENIKTIDFKDFVAKKYNKRDTVSIPYTYSIDTTVSDTVTDTVTESNLEKTQIAEITKCYEENIGMITPAISEILFSYLENMNYELIIKAIKIATLQNKRNSAYINGILKDWNRKGYKLLADIQETDKKNKKEYEQRNYTEKDFEKFYAN